MNTQTIQSAKFNPSAKTKFTTSHRKEGKVFFESYNALVPTIDHEGKPSLKAVVELRLYGTDQTWYAAIWMHSKEKSIHTSGTGSAGGYGYHKPSAAAAEAIENAGFKLTNDISGVGDGAIIEAIQAIAAEIGYPNTPVFKAHQ